MLKEICHVISRLSQSDSNCAGKISSQQKLRMKIYWKGRKTQKKCVKIRLRGKFYSFFVKNPEFCADLRLGVRLF